MCGVWSFALLSRADIAIINVGDNEVFSGWLIGRRVRGVVGLHNTNLSSLKQSF